MVIDRPKTLLFVEFVLYSNLASLENSSRAFEIQLLGSPVQQ